MRVKRRGGRHNKTVMVLDEELEEEEDDIGEKTLHDIAEEEEKDVYDPAV